MPRTRKASFRHRVANRSHCARIAAEIADGGEPAARHFQRVRQAQSGRVRNGIFLREVCVPGRPGRLRQVDVDVGHARHHRAVALVDDGRAGGRSEAVLDPRDPPILDDHGRRSARGQSGIDDQTSGLDGIGFGAGSGSGGERRDGG